MRVTTYWSFVILLALLAGCAWQPITEPRRFDAANEPTPLPLRKANDSATFTVERGTVAQRFVLRGRVGSAHELPIESDRDGTVSNVVVINGDAIIEGDLLALLDTQAIDVQLAAIRTALITTEAQLALQTDQLSAERTAAALTLERATLQFETAQENGATAAEQRVLQIDVELAQLTVDQLDSTIDPQLQADKLALQQRIADLNAQKETMRLYAPTDGDLVGLNLGAGRRVRTGSVIGTLIDLSQPVVWADATNSELAQLEEEMMVTLTIPDAPDETFDGTIVSLPFPHGNGGARSEAIEIVSAELPPQGSRVNVIITVAEKADALWLPPVALRDFAGQTFVIVRDDDGERRVDVEIGLMNAVRVEIVAGLQSGDVVVAP